MTDRAGRRAAAVRYVSTARTLRRGLENIAVALLFYVCASPVALAAFPVEETSIAQIHAAYLAKQDHRSRSHAGLSRSHCGLRQARPVSELADHR